MGRRHRRGDSQPERENGEVGTVMPASNARLGEARFRRFGGRRRCVRRAVPIESIPAIDSIAESPEPPVPDCVMPAIEPAIAGWAAGSGRTVSIPCFMCLDTSHQFIGYAHEADDQRHRHDEPEGRRRRIVGVRPGGHAVGLRHLMPAISRFIDSSSGRKVMRSDRR